jgi:hypothetical protein
MYHLSNDFISHIPIEEYQGLGGRRLHIEPFRAIERELLQVMPQVEEQAEVPDLSGEVAEQGQPSPRPLVIPARPLLFLLAKAVLALGLSVIPSPTRLISGDFARDGDAAVAMTVPRESDKAIAFGTLGQDHWVFDRNEVHSQSPTERVGESSVDLGKVITGRNEAHKKVAHKFP